MLQPPNSDLKPKIGALLISLFGAVQKFILEFPKTHKQGHAVLSIIVLRVSFNIPRVK